MENKTLILDLVEWIADGPRPYDAVMQAWGTTCPSLMVWEDTVDAGFVRVRSDESCKKLVEVTDSGKTFLETNRRGG